MKETAKLIIIILFAAVALSGSIAALFCWEEPSSIKVDLITNILNFVGGGL